MKHIIFPTVAEADAFIADLQQRGVVRPEVGTATVNRRSTTTTTDSTVATDSYGGAASPGAEDAGAGAVKGTGVGAAVGATAGVLSAAGIIGTAAATVATGGLALPVILGMTALGAGVGAAVGGAGGAMGVDENHDGLRAGDGSAYEVDDTHYDTLHTSVSGGGRAVAVDDAVPSDVLHEAMARHNGQLVSGSSMTTGMSGERSAAGDMASAAGNKVEEGADRLRAAGHEVAGAITGNPKHDMMAAEDRAKANMNNAQANSDYTEGKREARDGDGH